jgi:predicted acylesterase/phospholipase RssA
MKGGVTSGIVYPPLVYKLYKNNYRFRNIGGTSAGAIMAAITAAAEYGREARNDKREGGFEKLDKIKEQLGEGTFLRDLFQPSKETRPLYDFLLRSAEVAKGEGQKAKHEGLFKKTWRVAGKLQRASPLRFLSAFTLGTLLGFGIAYLFILIVGGVPSKGSSLAVLIVSGLLGALAGYSAAFGMGGYRLVQVLTRKIPDNYFGMCTGLKDDSMPQQQQVLTNWLNDSINNLAGITDKKMPLTFGMLKQKRFVKQAADEEGINLRMMTCNVSQNQPYVLPFTDQLLMYNQKDFKKFFPEEIVEYMKTKAPQKPAYDCAKIEDHFFLPAADDLPVIVATRLSLSFPLLLSALPLYTIVPDKIVTDETKPTVKLEKADLKLNLFSDGGIASNFPIQFFDAWLPTRPTFGVNLTSLPEEGFCYEGEDLQGALKPGFWNMLSLFQGEKNKVRSEYSSPTADPASKKAQDVTGDVATPTAARAVNNNAIYLPAADDLLFTEWIPLTKKSEKTGVESPNLFKFLWAIFTTAQNYRDNMQAMLPSYRERIVQIRLSDDEGGLNLAMQEKTIRKVMEKGEEAGRLLLENFDFRVHQWVRFQVLLIQMEKYLEKTWKVARPNPDTLTRQFDYESLIKDQEVNNYPYRRDEKWTGYADRRMKTMGHFIEGWQESKLADDPPLPEAVLRVAPEI